MPAGAYRGVLLRRWDNSLGRTRWDSSGGEADKGRHLVLEFAEPTADPIQLPSTDALIACGRLLSDDGSAAVDAAVLLEAPDAEAAEGVLAAEEYVAVEVHQWRFGGRPS